MSLGLFLNKHLLKAAFSRPSASVEYVTHIPPL